MKSIKLFYCLSILTLLFTACNEENYDVLGEIENPEDPTILLNDNTLVYSRGNAELYNGQGVGVRFTNIYGIASENLVCDPDGGGYNISLSGDDWFTLQLSQRPDGEFDVLYVIITGEFDGESKSLAGGLTSFIPFSCQMDGNPLTFVADEVTDDKLRGTLSGDLYGIEINDPDSLNNCSNFVNLGEFTAEFSVEIIPCG